MLTMNEVPPVYIAMPVDEDKAGNEITELAAHFHAHFTHGLNSQSFFSHRISKAQVLTLLGMVLFAAGATVTARMLFHDLKMRDEIIDQLGKVFIFPNAKPWWPEAKDTCAGWELMSGFLEVLQCDPNFLLLECSELCEQLSHYPAWKMLLTGSGFALSVLGKFALTAHSLIGGTFTNMCGKLFAGEKRFDDLQITAFSEGLQREFTALLLAFKDHTNLELTEHSKVAEIRTHLESMLEGYEDDKLPVAVAMTQ